MGRQLDVLVAPLGGPIDARDEGGPMNAAEVPVDEGVPGLRPIGGPLGQPEMPLGVVVPGM